MANVDIGGLMKDLELSLDEVIELRYAIEERIAKLQTRGMGDAKSIAASIADLHRILEALELPTA